MARKKSQRAIVATGHINFRNERKKRRRIIRYVFIQLIIFGIQFIYAPLMSSKRTAMIGHGGAVRLQEPTKYQVTDKDPLHAGGCKIYQLVGSVSINNFAEPLRLTR